LSKEAFRVRHVGDVADVAQRSVRISTVARRPVI
jgi:hypothetical protein